jgi:hypothetical protein
LCRHVRAVSQNSGLRINQAGKQGSAGRQVEQGGRQGKAGRQAGMQAVKGKPERHEALQGRAVRAGPGRAGRKAGRAF